MLTILYLSIFTFSSLFGQEVVTKKELDKKTLKLYMKALSHNRNRDFDEALMMMNRVLKKYPDFVNGHLRKSGILYNMEQFDSALKSIGIAIDIDPHGDPEMYMSKGILHSKLREFGAAAGSFEKYITLAEDGVRKQKAITLYEQSRFREQALLNPVPYIPIKLEGAVNSPTSEYIPMVTMDGTKMIFTRRVGGQEDLFIAEKKDSVFSEVYGMAAINTSQNEGVHTISSDGSRIIFTACNRYKEVIGGCDLFTSRLVDGEWSKPLNIGPVINTTAWDAQPSLSADGYTLYWSSSRKHGIGGNDIWMSTRTDTSSWTTPELLSENINGPYNEESPFIHPDGKTLYFRSNRPVGMGGYDIFYSRFNDTTNTWGVAKNIGYPINTENDEGAMSVSLDGKTAFFATDQKTGIRRTKKNLDIYTFELYEEARPQLVTFVKARIIDDISKLPISADIEIVNLSNKSDSKKGHSGKDGNYINSLLVSHEYGFFVSAPGYIYKSLYFDLSEMKPAYDPYVLEIKMTKIPAKEKVETHIVEKPKPIILENIFFESGSSALDKKSNIEIKRLAELIIRSGEMNVEIAGHTDNVGSIDENQRLSEDRARAVVDALVSYGVSKEKLSYIGLGETNPLESNETAQGRKINRRTTFRIL